MLAAYPPSNVRYNVPANWNSAKPKALAVAVKQLTHNSSADFCMEAGKQLRKAVLPLSHKRGQSPFLQVMARQPPQQSPFSSPAPSRIDQMQARAQRTPSPAPSPAPAASGRGMRVKIEKSRYEPSPMSRQPADDRGIRGSALPVTDDDSDAFDAQEDAQEISRLKRKVMHLEESKNQ